MKHEITDKTAIWRERIRDWRKSGKAQARFCRENGLALATFGFWKKRLSEQVDQRFIRISSKSATIGTRVKLIIPGGVKITFGESSPLHTITAVLETLCVSSGTR